MGGCDDSGDSGVVVATVEAYNPRTNTWRSCLPLSQRREGAVAGVVGGRLIVAGGHGGLGVGPLTSVEAYTPTGWTPLPPLPHAAWNATACVLNGRLYVMGGFGSNKLQVLEMSEENGFSWTVKADLPAARHAAAGAVVDGKLWLCGGRVRSPTGDFESTATVVTYDLQNDSWATGPALPRAINFCSAAVCDGEVHVTGCTDHSDQIGFVYRGERWVELPHASGALCRGEGTCQSLLLG